MGRYKAVYDRHGLLAEYSDGVLIFQRDGVELTDNSTGVQVVRDIEPYKSMITGETITSRSKHREHLRAHGCVEVGNDTSHMKPRAPQVPKVSMREAISRRLGDMSDRQANAILRDLRRN